MSVAEYKAYGEMLWKTRRLDRRNISINRAATIVGCDPRTFKSWEDGRGAPDGVQITRLEQEFGWVLKLRRGE